MYLLKPTITASQIEVDRYTIILIFDLVFPVGRACGMARDIAKGPPDEGVNPQI